MKRALFLDRDGTLVVDTGYPRDPAIVTLLPGVGTALREAKALGFELVVVSNQSGVARGIIAPEELAAVTARVGELLAAEGVVLDDVRYCRHGPDDGCACRKPRPGMLQDAAAARAIDLTRSVMVGDRDSDMLAGHAAGCTTVIVGGASVNADYAIGSFEALVPILRSLG
ncbi:MAG: HAD family hydrolase [Labilithrix sp.]|nr:HAD family hydrolase [Labilithrix sp.]MCW5810327.1 HAD family hydrolase [Labilithrix sp.]